MSKKETRRAARQAFPKASSGARAGTAARNKGSSVVPLNTRGSRAKPTAARPALRPPTLKRAAIQGAILAVLYLIVIRFLWKQEETSTLSYIIFPLAGFVVYTGIAYAIDKFTYQRRLRKLKGQSK
jgi:hypothetical protein